MERRSWAGEDRVRGPPGVAIEAKEDGKGQPCRSLGLEAALILAGGSI